VSKNTPPSIKMAKSGSSRAARVDVRAIALTRAGFPSSGAISSLNAIFIFSLIFFFIFPFLLYFKGVSIYLYTLLRIFWTGVL